ncbi:MAG: YdcF family protein [Armatimonadota bacterium]
MLLEPQTVDDLNLLARFLAAPEPLPERADLIVVLGSALPINATYGAQLFHQGVAQLLLISGGIGHSTPSLWANLEEEGIEGEDRAEADIFQDLLVSRYQVPSEKILVESVSTNCGSNAIQSKRLLDQVDLHPQSLVLIQDPTMQLRSKASFQKSFPEAEIFNAPPFVPAVTPSGLENEGWSFDRFLELVLGEIPRLAAYGPKGQGFIAEVDVPENVRATWIRLSNSFPEHIRGVAQ